MGEDDPNSVMSGGTRSVAIGGDAIGTHIHTGDIILQGVRSLSPDYAARIENFLAEYRGDPKAPVPFGGRANEIQRLNSWLLDDSAEPYLLLAAPAGRGKSALLVRWIGQLDTLVGAKVQHHHSVAFVPISIRFRTNLEGVAFGALAAQLARLRGDRPIASLGGSADAWRATAAEYLSSLPAGSRLLVVIDGVDEAADWEVGPDAFPLRPPDGLRVVLSTRLTATSPTAEAWLHRLGWSRPGLAVAPRLHLLDSDGVADVLRRSGVPLDELAARPEIVQELYRLTQGDPLLVRLYVQDLWAQGDQVVRIRAEDLPSIKPGLQGYFEHWLADQRRLWGEKTPLREFAVQGILSLLAAASGPLRRADLLQLVPDSAGLNTWTFDDHIRPLDRFITGDPNTGLAFVHPRLGIFFWDRMSEAERLHWNSTLTSWGESVFQRVQTGLTLGDVPPYLIQFFGSHLERSNAGAEQLGRLVSKSWADVWRSLEGGFSGYLTDVDRAWRSARHANAQAIVEVRSLPRLDLEVRSALSHSTVRSFASQLTGAVLGELVASGDWSSTQALAYARQIPRADKRVEALTALAIRAPGVDRDALIDEALLHSTSILDERRRYEVLLDMASAINERVSLRAVASAGELKNPYQVSRVLAAYAHALTPESISAAIPLVLRVFDSDRARVLTRLAPRIPEPLFPAAIRAARSIADRLQRVRAIASLAHVAPSRLTDDLAAEVRTLVESAKDPAEKALCLAAQAPLLPASQTADLVGGLVRVAPTPVRDIAIVELARYVSADWFTRFVEVVLRIPEATSRAWILKRLPTKVLSQTAGEILAAAESLRAVPEDCATILAQLVEHISPDSIPQLYQVTRSLPPHVPEVRSLACALAPHLALQERRDLASWALAGTRKVPTDVDIALSKHLGDARRNEILDDIDRRIHLIGDEGDVAVALSTLAPFLPGASIERALSQMDTLSDDRDRLRAWCGVFHRVDPAQQPGLATRIIALARTERDDALRNRAIDVAAPSLDPVDLQDQLSRITEMTTRVTRLAILERLLRFAGAEVSAAVIADEVLLWKLDAARTRRADAGVESWLAQEEEEVAGELSLLVRWFGELLTPDDAATLLQAAATTVTRRARSTALNAILPVLDSEQKSAALADLSLGSLSPATIRAVAADIPQEMIVRHLDALDRARAELDGMYWQRETGLNENFREELTEEDAGEYAWSRAAFSENDAAKLHAVMPFSSPQLRRRITDTILDSLPSVAEEKWGWEWIAEYGAELVTDDRAGELLDRVREIESRTVRGGVLLATSVRLPAELKSEAIEEALVDLHDRWGLPEVALIPRVLDSLTEDQLEGLRAELSHGPLSSVELLSLSTSLVSSDIDTVVNAGLDVLVALAMHERSTASEGERPGAAAMTAATDQLLAIMQYVSASTWAKAWDTGRAIAAQGEHRTIHDALTERLSVFSTEERYRALVECLQLAATSGRSMFLSHFAPVAGIVGVLCEPVAVQQVADGLRETADWWP
jgi:hypothetical protein